MVSERAFQRAFFGVSAPLWQHGGNGGPVHIHVGDGRDADRRRLDDLDGVDADARTDMARRHGIVRVHVGRDDGGDDAALVPMLWCYRQAVGRTGETRLGR